MDSILQHIARLSDTRDTASNPFQRLAECIRANYGPCAVAIVTTDGLEAGRGQVTGLYTHDGEVVVEAPDLFAFNPGLPSKHCDLLLQLESRPDDQPLFLEVLTTKPALDPRLAVYESMLAIPLFIDGQAVNWMLLLAVDPEVLAGIDRAYAALVANLAATCVARVRDTRQLREASQWIEKELEEIAALQRLLRPQDDLRLKGARVAVYTDSYGHAGGDYYDIMRLTSLVNSIYPETLPDLWGVIIADVSGHGAAAAVEAAMFDAILRTYRGTVEDGPACVFAYANRYFFTRRIRGNFITAFVANYDPRTRLLTYTNAGHPAPILCRAATGKLERLEAFVGVPLGIAPDAGWENVTVSMEPGDLLVMFTDGVTEARNAEDRPLGRAALVDWIREGPCECDALLTYLCRRLEEYQAGTEQADDQTLLLVQVE